MERKSKTILFILPLIFSLLFCTTARGYVTISDINYPATISHEKDIVITVFLTYSDDNDYIYLQTLIIDYSVSNESYFNSYRLKAVFDEEDQEKIKVTIPSPHCHPGDTIEFRVGYDWARLNYACHRVYSDYYTISVKNAFMNFTDVENYSPTQWIFIGLVGVVVLSAISVVIVLSKTRR